MSKELGMEPDKYQEPARWNLGMSKEPDKEQEPAPLWCSEAPHPHGYHCRGIGEKFSRYASVVITKVGGMVGQ